MALRVMKNHKCYFDMNDVNLHCTEVMQRNEAAKCIHWFNVTNNFKKSEIRSERKQ